MPLATVTVTTADVVEFPAASRARALRPCEPSAAVALSQEVEYGAVVSSVPRFAPSRRNCTPATPTLSEALAVTVVVAETVAPAAGAVTDTVGGVVSPVPPSALKATSCMTQAVPFWVPVAL